MRSAIAAAIVALAWVTPAAAGESRGVASFDWTEVVDAYSRVHDYTCLYRKEERAISNGELQSMRLYFRKPLDVKLEWLNGNGEVDQVAVYRQGMNDGKVLARKSGLGSVMGTMKLDPTSRRALADSKHPITEIGFGTIVDRTSRDIREGRLSSKSPTDEAVLGREAYRFDVGSTSVWIDRELKLPIQVEVRDPAGALLERHRFTNIRINPGLTDQVFTL
jgi:outer membrane lipoprotein-sorting protein